MKFKGKRVDSNEWVCGYYFVAPLSSENFEADHFGGGFTRHCISDEHGVVYEVEEKSVSHGTGKIDKEGVEVFVGDKIQCFSIPNDEGRRDVVFLTRVKSLRDFYSSIWSREDACVKVIGSVLDE